MKTENPFRLSNDNKRYHTWNYYLRNTYGKKVFKIPLNAGFTCPNRDGICGYQGCSFCGSMGSGEFVEVPHASLTQQFSQGKQRIQKKYDSVLFMPYFQAFTNTYAPLSKLKDLYTPFIQRDDVAALCIATRADCLEDDKIAYFDSLCAHKDVWMELGLQSMHDKTASRIHRGHDLSTFLDCIKRLSQTRIHICVHIINSLPYESKEEMLETASLLANLPIHAVKIHMLHIMENTQMYEEYQLHPFPLLSSDQYIDIVVQQLELLREDIIIQRLTGDGDKKTLFEPKWTMLKKQILNDIDKAMLSRNTWQGRHYK